MTKARRLSLELLTWFKGVKLCWAFTIWQLMINNAKIRTEKSSFISFKSRLLLKDSRYIEIPFGIFYTTASRCSRGSVGFFIRIYKGAGHRFSEAFLRTVSWERGCKTQPMTKAPNPFSEIYSL